MAHVQPILDLAAPPNPAAATSAALNMDIAVLPPTIVAPDAWLDLAPATQPPSPLLPLLPRRPPLPHLVRGLEVR